MIKISVIVPVYGVENYIKKCIDSLVNQTFKDFEILVVNDGTKDKSIDIIKENFNDKRIKILDKKNGGLSDARNYALPYAKGEYVLYVDSDDYVHPEILEKMYNRAIKDKADIVLSLAYKDEDGVITPLETPYNEDLETKIRYILNRPSAWSKLVKKEIMEKKELAFLKGKIYEDLATMPALCLYTDKISFMDDYLYYYLIRDGSIMNQKVYKKNMEDIFDSLDHLYSLFKLNKKEKEYSEELESLYISHLLHNMAMNFLPFKEGRVCIKRSAKLIKERFPKWYKNKYFRRRNIKYRIVCYLFYFRLFFLVKLVLHKYYKKSK